MAQQQNQPNKETGLEIESALQRLLKGARVENGGGSQLTKACGGLLVDMPAHGKATAAANFKVDTPFTAKGGLKSLMQLAGQQQCASDGTIRDPSICTIVPTWLGDKLGAASQQPDLAPNLLTNAIVCMYASLCMQQHLQALQAAQKS